MPRVFNLQPYGSRKIEQGNLVVLTPEDVETMIVMAAWSYAVRYTAKGLDLPNYEAATKLMLQRHPSWELLQTPVASVPVNLQVADNDIPESE